MNEGLSPYVYFKNKISRDVLLGCQPFFLHTCDFLTYRCESTDRLHIDRSDPGRGRGRPYALSFSDPVVQGRARRTAHAAKCTVTARRSVATAERVNERTRETNYGGNWIRNDFPP